MNNDLFNQVKKLLPSITHDQFKMMFQLTQSVLINVVKK